LAFDYQTASTIWKHIETLKCYVLLFITRILNNNWKHIETLNPEHPPVYTVNRSIFSSSDASPACSSFIICNSDPPQLNIKASTLWLQPRKTRANLSKKKKKKVEERKKEKIFWRGGKIRLVLCIFHYGSCACSVNQNLKR
jgi:hypothetical protein